MRPDTANLLRSVSYTLETAIVPAIDGDFQKSLGYTAVNLLRYATERVENEYALARADVEQLLTVLDSIHEYFKSLPQPDAAVARQLDQLGITRSNAPGPFLSPSELNAWLLELNERLDASLKTLIAMPAEIQNAPEYVRVRTEIRTLLGESLLREKAVIERAFISKRR